MLILNPERLRATTQPLETKNRPVPGYVTVVQITIAAVAAVAALVVGFAVTQYLSEFWPLWSVIVAVGVFVFLAAYTVILIEEFLWHAIIAIVWGACLTFGLPWHNAVEALALTAIITVSAVSGFLMYKSASKGYAALHLFTTVREYASSLATGIVIALIVLYAAAVSHGSALLPAGILANATDRAAQFVPTILPGVQPESKNAVSVHDLAMASARAQLESDPRYRALTPEEQQKVLKTAADQAAAAFTKQLGVKSNASTSIGTVAQGAVSGILNRFHDRYGIYFTIAWLLGAFFIARSAAVLMTLIISALVWVSIYVLVAMNALRIESTPAIHERISF